MRLLGYEFVKQADFNDNLLSFGQSTYGGSSMEQLLQAPGPAMPVYSDGLGNEYVAGRMGGAIQPLPFLSGSPIRQHGGSFQDAIASGGFVPLEAMPQPEPRGLDAEVLAGVAGNVSPESATGWLGGAAKNAMLGMAPGQGSDRILAALGVKNPFSRDGQDAAFGPLIKNVVEPQGDTAASSGGKQGSGGKPGSAFGLTSLLPAAGAMLKGGAAAATGGAIGRAGLQQVLKAAGVDFPGASTAANVLGGMLGGALGDKVGGLMDSLGLDDLAGGLTDALPGGLGIPGSTPPFVPGNAGAAGDPPLGIAPGGCFPGGKKEPPVDLEKLGGEALEGAADEALKQWKVDDESSAAETVANKLVKDNTEQLKQAVKDPDGLLDKIKGYFVGKPAGKGEWAVRIGDLDNKGDVSVMGVGNILFQGQSVSRMTDKVSGPMAPPPGLPIAQGKTQVKSAGLATAFRTAKTFVVSEMLTGAPTILVGGAASTLAPPPAPPKKDTPGNSAPPAPKDPPKSQSGSAGAEKPQGEQEQKAKNEDAKNADQRGEKGKDEGGDQGKEGGKDDAKGKPVDTGMVGDLGGGIEDGSETAGEQGELEKQAKLEQDKLNAEADKKFEQGDRARAEAEKLKVEAADARRSADADFASGGDSNKDFSSPAKDRIKAGNKEIQAGEKAKQAAQFDADGQKIKAKADGIDLKPRIPKTKTPLVFEAPPKTFGGRAGFGIGVASDVKDVFDSVGRMEQHAANGDRREIVKDALGTSGSLIYGAVGASVMTGALVAFGVGTGGLGFVVIGGWALVAGTGAGYLGGAAGEEIGNRVADQYGIDNKSGRRDPTKIENGTRYVQDWWGRHVSNR